MSFPSDDKESPTNSEQRPDSNSRPAATAGACQSKPRERRPASALQLLKEDFGLFKQDILNIFKDKDGKSSATKDKTPLSVSLKDDLDLFKNELTSLTEDISGILRKSLRKEEDGKIKAQEQQADKAETGDSFKIKAQEQQADNADTDDSFKIKAQEQQADNAEKDNSSIIKAQEQQADNAEADDSFKIKAQEQQADNADTDHSFKITAQDQPRDGEVKKTVKIKAQEQIRQSGDIDEYESFKLKANEKEEWSGNAEKAETFTITVQNENGDRVNQSTFKIKAEVQHEQQSEKTKNQDPFKINVNEQKTERKNPFRIKLQNIARGKNKEDSYKIKAPNGSRFKRKENSFKLKDPKNTDESQKEQNDDEFGAEGWELVERHELEENTDANESLVPKETKTQMDPVVLRSDGVDRTEAESNMAAAGFPEAAVLVLRPPLISLSSEVGLLRLRGIANDEPRCELREDVWAIKNFAQYLTLDPNTANAELLLSDGNRTVRRVWSRDHVTSQLTDHMTDHPERFEHCPQVLCREGLLDAVYWEVQWTGGADVGVTYNSITRRGQVSDGLLGHTCGSWSLECTQGSYTPCHRQRRYRSVCPEPFSHRVGVFLDFEAGALSFYCISPTSMQHLHTFRATFTEPLYPGFWLWSWGGSVSLSQVELGWERLLQ